jgi:hypothetical protein
MEKVTSEMILKNYPAVWWEIWRQGRTETLNDPSAQQEMAQRHLQVALTKPGPSSPGNSSPASPASPSPQAPAVPVSATQTAINKQLGLDEATFNAYVGAGQR